MVWNVLYKISKIVISILYGIQAFDLLTNQNINTKSLSEWKVTIFCMAEMTRRMCLILTIFDGGYAYIITFLCLLYSNRVNSCDILARAIIWPQKSKKSNNLLKSLFWIKFKCRSIFCSIHSASKQSHATTEQHWIMVIQVW